MMNFKELLIGISSTIMNLKVINVPYADPNLKLEKELLL